MPKIENLNEIQLDALQETGNIGCSHAATAISGMINKEINITVPVIKIKKFKELRDTLVQIAGGNEKIVGVYLELTEEFLGSILFLFPYESALILSDLLMFQEIGTNKKLDEMGQSAITEVGNIVVSAYTNAMGKLLDCTVMLSPPTFSMDFPDIFIDKINNLYDDKTSHALMFDTLFKGESDLFKSYFILLPSPKSLDVLLDKLACKLNNQKNDEVQSYINSLSQEV